MKKRLIEWKLPLADILEECPREKNIRHSLLVGGTIND
jgi:adenine-specific DNA methylase